MEESLIKLALSAAWGFVSTLLFGKKEDPQVEKAREFGEVSVENATLKKENDILENQSKVEPVRSFDDVDRVVQRIETGDATETGHLA